MPSISNSYPFDNPEVVLDNLPKTNLTKKNTVKKGKETRKAHKRHQSISISQPPRYEYTRAPVRSLLQRQREAVIREEQKKNAQVPANFDPIYQKQQQLMMMYQHRSAAPLVDPFPPTLPAKKKRTKVVKPAPPPPPPSEVVDLTSTTTTIPLRFDEEHERNYQSMFSSSKRHCSQQPRGYISRPNRTPAKVSTMVQQEAFEFQPPQQVHPQYLQHPSKPTKAPIKSQHVPQTEMSVIPPHGSKLLPDDPDDDEIFDHNLLHAMDKDIEKLAHKKFQRNNDGYDSDTMEICHELRCDPKYAFDAGPYMYEDNVWDFLWSSREIDGVEKDEETTKEYSDLISTPGQRNDAFL